MKVIKPVKYPFPHRRRWHHAACLERLEERRVLDSTVVFNELLYHPIENDQEMEFIELHNQMAVDMDISDWRLEAGVRFTFPEGTVVPGGGYLVVAQQPDRWPSVAADRLLGPYEGRLQNGGERLELRDRNGRLMDWIAYQDAGKWPSAADGTGVSLAKIDPNQSSPPAENWGSSLLVGGTPGEANFPNRSAVENQPTLVDVVTLDSAWEYLVASETPPPGWNEIGQQGPGWQNTQLSAPGPYFAGAPLRAGVLAEPVTNVTAIASSALSGQEPIHAVDGSGRSDDRHVTAPVAGNMWLSNGNFFGVTPDLDPEITFDLGSERSVDRMRVWNYNGADTPTCCTNRGVRVADILVAGEDGLFRPLIDNQPFDRAPGTDEPFGQDIDLQGVTARFIKIDVDTSNGVANHGDPFQFVGLSEVQFYAFPLPGATRLPLSEGSYYFRREFSFDQPAELTSLQLTALWEDGGALYLNGVELLRENVPSGPLSADSRALTDFAVADLSETVLRSGASLVQGRNVLAAEVHAAALPPSADADALFAVQLRTSTAPALSVLDALPRVQIQEIAGAADPGFFVEIVNRDERPVDLASVAIRSTGAGSWAPLAGVLPPGQRIAFAPLLVPQPGDRLYLVDASHAAVLDAVVVEPVGRGRPEATPRVLTPEQLASTGADESFWQISRSTPGEPNEFSIDGQIVINEIMYHHRPDAALPAVPPTFALDRVIPMDASWRYLDDGAGLPADWFASSHASDGSWKEGRALLGFETGRIVPPGLNTELAEAKQAQVMTLYFEREVDLTAEQLAATDEIQLQLIVDDGAIAYVNGVEVARLNMPDGPVDVSTRASAAVNNATPSDVIRLDKALFQAGINRVSVEVHQRSASSSDMLFGASLTLGRITEPGTPATAYREIDQEWIELFHRGDSPVDLSGWSLADAVNFTFPAGTVLRPGEYLVIANDAQQMKSLWPEIADRVIGDFDARLGNHDERIVLLDQVGNPVDVVHYFEGGKWPEAADGGGSTLELRDPWADNGRGLAWDASREGNRASWKTYKYRGIAEASAVGPDNQWQEFVMGLLAPGEVLLDDIRVVAAPGGDEREFIQNTTFEQDAIGSEPDHWRIVGNHRHSEVIVDPDDPANQALRLVATGPTEHMSNHAETTLKDGDSRARITNGQEYEVSFRAKWISGSNLLNTRLYFNRLPRTTPIEQPARHGTPGRVNSTFAGNLGPTYEAMRHNPPVPEAGQPVEVSVGIDDPQQVAAATLWYSVDSGSWQQTRMAASGGNRYVGIIPGQDTASIVQFYVQGADTLGAETTFPRRGADSRALYKVQDGLASNVGLHNFRIIVTPDDADLLHSTTELMSNDRIGTTIIYDESEIIYDAGVRLSGSERARPFEPRLSFSIGFPADQLFRGVHSSITLDRSESTGFGQREHIYHHGMSRAGGLPSEYNDLFNIITPRRAHTGSAEAQLARYSDTFLDEQFENGSEGQLYEYELIYYPTTTVGRDPEGRKLPQPDQVQGLPIRYISDDKEDYRWTFLNKNNRQQDDYSQLIEFTRIMSLSGSQFESKISQVADVDQWLRAFAFGAISGHGDNYLSDGSQHNLQLYVRPTDGRVLLFPHDLDAFFNVNRALVGNGDLRKLLRVPEWEHMYYGHVYDMIQTTFNQSYMKRWTDHWGALLPGQRFDRHLTDLVRRSDFLIRQITRQAAEIPFAIVQSPVAVDAPSARVQGNGWVNVREIRQLGSDQPLSVRWTDVTQWEADVPVPKGESTQQLQAFDFQGNLIGTVDFSVISTAEELSADFDNSGTIDAADLDLICAALSAPEPRFDLNRDARVDVADVDYLLAEVLRTGRGDANLDGQFDSKDLLLVFQTGEYEDQIADNSLWAEGDWDCDGDFTADDLLLALQSGNYRRQ